jgi:hypothetical protein
MKKWSVGFLQGSMGLFDDLRSGRRLEQVIHPVLTEKAVQFMQDPLSPLQDCRSDLFMDPSPQIELTRIPDSLGLAALSANQKTESVSYSWLAPAAPEDAKQTDIERIIAGDKFWFLLNWLHDSAWTTSLSDLLEKAKQKSETEMWMLASEK